MWNTLTVDSQKPELPSVDKDEMNFPKNDAPAYTILSFQAKYNFNPLPTSPFREPL
jgi:hypothetical protein